MLGKMGKLLTKMLGKRGIQVRGIQVKCWEKFKKRAFKSNVGKNVGKTVDQNVGKSPKCILTKFELSASCRIKDIVIQN